MALKRKIEKERWSSTKRNLYLRAKDLNTGIYSFGGYVMTSKLALVPDYKCETGRLVRFSKWYGDHSTIF
jgi:hypothetical protein